MCSVRRYVFSASIAVMLGYVSPRSQALSRASGPFALAASVLFSL
jgi:hypothetical protein